MRERKRTRVLTDITQLKRRRRMNREGSIARRAYWKTCKLERPVEVSVKRKTAQRALKDPFPSGVRWARSLCPRCSLIETLKTKNAAALVGSNSFPRPGSPLRTANQPARLTADQTIGFSLCLEAGWKERKKGRKEGRASGLVLKIVKREEEKQMNSLKLYCLYEKAAVFKML